ncbi:MAG: carboxypeptidase regulatory-like domain-containing protein [Cyanobacteria bacterium P01_A01_bin.17]
MMRKRLIPVLGILMGVWTGPAVFAHGAAVNYRITSKNVEIEAAFDTGEPMVNAQIAVYAPDQLSQPWLTGKADREGRFTFTPPADQTGTWQVKVRQAGHGKILNIPVSSENNIAAKASLPTAEEKAALLAQVTGRMAPEIAAQVAKEIAEG